MCGGSDRALTHDPPPPRPLGLDLPLIRDRLLSFLGLGLGLALLLLSACGGGQSAKGSPALWLAERDGIVAHIFGTIHVLPGGVDWETPALKQAMATSDRLVLEAVDLDGAQTVFEDMALSPGLPPIEARIPARDRPTLAALMKRGGLTGPTLSEHESWAAALVLSTVVQSQLGVTGGNGVEPALTAAFRAAGKPVGGIETLEEQFGMFDRLPEPVQRGLLVETIAESRNARQDYDRMLRAWLGGDMATIASLYTAQTADEAALANALLAHRNRLWAQRMDAMRGRPFLAVGAAHLTGPDNLITLLEARGWTVRRVQ